VSVSRAGIGSRSGAGALVGAAAVLLSRSLGRGGGRRRRAFRSELLFGRALAGGTPGRVFRAGIVAREPARRQPAGDALLALAGLHRGQIEHAQDHEGDDHHDGRRARAPAGPQYPAHALALGDLLLGGRGDRIGDLRFDERVSARVLVLRAFHTPALLVERGAHGGEVAAAAIIVVVKRPRGRLRGLGRIRLLHLERTLA